MEKLAQYNKMLMAATPAPHPLGAMRDAVRKLVLRGGSDEPMESAMFIRFVTVQEDMTHTEYEMIGAASKRKDARVFIY